MDNLENAINELHLIVKELFLAYPASGAGTGTMAVYVSDLADLPLEDLRMVFRAIRRQNTFLPTIAEIYRAVEALQKEKVMRRLEDEAARARALREAPGVPMPAEFKKELQKFISKTSRGKHDK